LRAFDGWVGLLEDIQSVQSTTDCILTLDVPDGPASHEEGLRRR